MPPDRRPHPTQGWGFDNNAGGFTVKALPCRLIPKKYWWVREAELKGV